jgi:hypothetical protein
MVYKKEGLSRTFPYYRELKNMTIKDMFPILVVGGLLDEF